jgi:hypothetical protein
LLKGGDDIIGVANRFGAIGRRGNTSGELAFVHYFLDDLVRLFQSLRIDIHECDLALLQARSQ